MYNDNPLILIERLLSTLLSGKSLPDYLKNIDASCESVLMRYVEGSGEISTITFLVKTDGGKSKKVMSLLYNQKDIVELLGKNTNIYVADNNMTIKFIDINYGDVHKSMRYLCTDGGYQRVDIFSRKSDPINSDRIIYSKDGSVMAVCVPAQHRVLLSYRVNNRYRPMDGIAMDCYANNDRIWGRDIALSDDGLYLCVLGERTAYIYRRKDNTYHSHGTIVSSNGNQKNWGAHFRFLNSGDVVVIPWSGKSNIYKSQIIADEVIWIDEGTV